jgi:hypothetical protein
MNQDEKKGGLPLLAGARGLVQVFRKCDDNFRLNFWRLGKARGRLTRGPRGAGCLGTVRTALGPALANYEPYSIVIE